MRNWLPIGMGILLSLSGILAISCGKKTEADLFQEKKISIDLSASVSRGYDPLMVDFSGYLQAGDRPVEREIGEVKWRIRGPHGFDREIVQESYYGEDESEEGFFYLQYRFDIPGTYRVQLILNDGEYVSRRVTVDVMDRGDDRPRRY